MHTILVLYSHKALDKLLQYESSLYLRKVTVSSLNEAIDIPTVAELHDQIVVGGSFRARDERDNMAMLYLCHYFNLVDQKLVVFASYLLAIDDFHSIVLLWIVLEVSVVNRAVLSLTKKSRREYNLNLVPRERYNFTTRLELVLLFLSFHL